MGTSLKLLISASLRLRAPLLIRSAVRVSSASFERADSTSRQPVDTSRTIPSASRKTAVYVAERTRIRIEPSTAFATATADRFLPQRSDQQAICSVTFGCEGSRLNSLAVALRVRVSIVADLGNGRVTILRLTDAMKSIPCCYGGKLRSATVLRRCPPLASHGTD